MELYSLEKVIVVGAVNAGKTCIVSRYTRGCKASMNTKATVGVDFALKDGLKRRGKTMHLQVWDISGQERFGTMTRIYFKDASGAVVVIAGKGKGGSSSSLEEAKQWKEDIDKKSLHLDGSPIPVILVANKDDLSGEPLHTDEELAQFSRENGFVGWLRASALTNTNISLAFDRLIEVILTNIENGKVVKEEVEGAVKLPTGGEKKKKKKKKFCSVA